MSRELNRESPMVSPDWACKPLHYQKLEDERNSEEKVPGDRVKPGMFAQLGRLTTTELQVHHQEILEYRVRSNSPETL